MSDPIEKWSTASFEEKYEMMMEKMSEADYKRSAVQVLFLCQCSKCPSNTESEEQNAVYCNIGKGERPREQKGCLCAECSITKTMSLRWDYYCTQGSALQRSNLEK